MRSLSFGPEEPSIATKKSCRGPSLPVDWLSLAWEQDSIRPSAYSRSIKHHRQYQ